jgi:hypothetical protein
VTHGRRSAPPEDCGGVRGYEEILAALAGRAVAGGVGDGEDANDAEEAGRLEWLREQFPYFSPEEFDLDAVNEWGHGPEPFWE